MIRQTRDTAFGTISMIEDQGVLVRLLLPSEPIPLDVPAGDSPLLQTAFAELSEYFAASRREFPLPLRAAGTPFQRAVWTELAVIPYGTTRSYGEVAKRLGKPGAARAVGMACHRNPLPILVPCHRVVGAGGHLTGFGGGIPMKKALLDLESGALALP
jgi:methylated-DNA-[protein]-cysteine S-methyltransferase